MSVSPISQIEMPIALARRPLALFSMESVFSRVLTTTNGESNPSRPAPRYPATSQASVCHRWRLSRI